MRCEKCGGEIEEHGRQRTGLYRFKCGPCVRYIQLPPVEYENVGDEL